MDEFTLPTDPLAQPFDFGSAQTPPFVQPKTPQGGMDRKQAMKLAIMLPLAMKAGPGAIQGLLQGFAQAEQQQYTRGRQSAQDTDLAAQRQAQQQYQQQQIQNARLTQQRQFMGDYTKGLEGLDTPEAIDAYTKLYGAQAGAYGISPDQLGTLAAPYKEPSRLQKRAVENYVKKLKSEYGEKWAETASQFTHTVPGFDKPLTFAELQQATGMAPDPSAPKTSADTMKADTPEKAHLVAFAQARGKTVGQLTDAELREATKQFRQADDRPVDPTLAALRDIQLQNARNAPALPPRVSQQVQSQAKAFDTNQVVKNTQTIAEAAQFVQSLDPNTKNPAEDQALIYAFAKAMDPNSVVREGEYATVQKYAQSWLQSFGFNAARVLTNTEFLTPQARANMKSTILKRFRAAQGQYNAVRDSYAGKINKLTGGTDGADYLTGYDTAFPQDPSAPGVTVQPARGGSARPAAGANPFRR